ncbi:hypothetical protein NK662_23235, partial [Ectobacillus sp. SYSU M60031]|nr:hypothetical protein [Ectobacillus ponti]
PGKQVQLSESEIRQLCTVSREIFLSQPNLLELEAPIKSDIIPEDQEGKTSFLFTPGDLEDCLGKIQLLLTDKEFRDNMGMTARA